MVCLSVLVLLFLLFLVRVQLRRYSEFALLDELLRRRYTNRIIAAFPAKEAGMARASFSSPTPEFIEARRSQLARWLTSIMCGRQL